MNAVTLASIRAHLPRLIASTLAIVIAVGFVVATLVLNETMKATVLQATAAEFVDTDVVVTSDDLSSLSDRVDALTALDGVQAVDPTLQLSVSATVPGRTGSLGLDVQSVAGDPSLQWQQMAAGALPAGPGEIAVSERVGAAVGDVLPVSTYDGRGESTARDMTVTGVVDLGGDPTAGSYGRAFVTAQQAQEWGATDVTELRIAAESGTEAGTLAAAVRAALPGAAATVRTGAEQAELAAQSLTGENGVLAATLLTFGTIAVLVAGLVIANTLAVLLAQRTRDLALLRCIGATAQQVRRSVLGEAALTGLAASVLGVLVGIGLAAAVSALVAATDSPVPLSGVSVPVSAVIVGVTVGTSTTLLAALAPARAATRVAPLTALRPADQAPLRSRGGVVRLASGLALAVPGTALMVLGVRSPQLLATLAGGVLSSLGLLLLAQRAVPSVVAAAGRLAGRFGGLPARLAAGNATRNPRRTATTATALLIGVTLTTAMVVGASSTRATAQAGLAAAYPTDVVVTTYEEIPASAQQQLAAADGVVAATGLTRGSVSGPDGEQTEVTGIDPAQALPVLRSTERITLPQPGQVAVPPWSRQTWGSPAGGQVTFTAGGRSGTFTVVEGTESALVMNEADLRALAPDAMVQVMWLRLADGIDQEAATDAVTDLAGTVLPDPFVTGLASERAALDEVVDVLLLIVTGLLGVAVVIALIGVGNTLALSVVERRQESGLLRALGLTRGQLRGLLAWEAVLVAGVAAVLGVLVGGSYGLAGATSMLGEIGEVEVTIDVPWVQVAAIVVVATAAGLLASVLPARRAARTPPVAALAG